MISYEDLLSTLLPWGFPIERYVTISLEKKENPGDNKELYPYVVYLSLEEKNIAPEGYSEEELESKGFSNTKTIYDLPIRNNLYRICVKWRRRDIKGQNRSIQSELRFVEEWTKDTRELAYFLKDGEGYWENFG